jgi:hypothetical protein
MSYIVASKRLQLLSELDPVHVGAKAGVATSNHKTVPVQCGVFLVPEIYTEMTW